LCPASAGGFDIVRIFLLAAALAFALFACSPQNGPAPQPSSAPTSLLQSPPPPAQQQAGHTLTVLPQNEKEGTASPVVVRRPPLALPQEAGTSQAASAAPGDITLNFSGADIRDVLSTVLGQTLKLNYVVDPEVTGPVTFNVSRPLRRDEVLPVLEAVLESRGFALVETDGIVRVLARSANGSVRAPLALNQGAVGERLEVFPVRYVAVADIASVLAKILPAGASIVPDERRKLLLIAGTSDELRLAADTIRVFDIDQLSGTSVALLPLKEADAADVVVELENIFDANRKEAETNPVRFLAITRLNAVMVLTQEPHLFDEARAWVARLDETRNMNEQRVYVYYLQYGKAGQVAQTLQGALSGIDVEVKGAETASPEGLAAESEPAGAAAPTPNSLAAEAPPTAPGFPTPPPLVASPPAPAPPPAPQQSGEENRPSVRIEADEAHNALIISATPKDYALIRDVLEGIDTPPMQVLIQVTVAEVTLNDSLQYGVEYFLNSRGQNSGNISTLLTTGNATNAITPTVPGFSLAFTAANLQPRVVLDALSGLTQTKVISTPQLMVLDNQTARLQVGDVVPIITQSAASTVTSSPLVLSNVEYKETGVVLEVTPRVNSSGYVTLDISQSVSSVVPTTTSTINSPTFSQRRLTSTISVRNGSSILLGGLIQDQDNRNSQGVPFLSEIPVLGALFGNRNDTTSRDELIMFMTPTVVSTDDQIADLTARVEREFNGALDRSNLVPPRPVPR
jgi:general secretion pathway protein D